MIVGQLTHGEGGFCIDKGTKSIQTDRQTGGQVETRKKFHQQCNMSGDNKTPNRWGNTQCPNISANVAAIEDAASAPATRLSMWPQKRTRDKIEAFPYSSIRSISSNSFNQMQITQTRTCLVLGWSATGFGFCLSFEAQARWPG